MASSGEEGRKDAKDGDSRIGGTPPMESRVPAPPKEVAVGLQGDAAVEVGDRMAKLLEDLEEEEEEFDGDFGAALPHSFDVGANDGLDLPAHQAGAEGGDASSRGKSLGADRTARREPPSHPPPPEPYQAYQPPHRMRRSDSERSVFSNHGETPVLPLCCYYLQKRCMKGEDCPFSHQKISDPSRARCSIGAACSLGHGSALAPAAVGARSQSRPRSASSRRQRSASVTSRGSVRPSLDGRVVCCYYLQDRCRHGDRCRWQHVGREDPDRVRCCYRNECLAGHGRLLPDEPEGAQRQPAAAAAVWKGSARSRSPYQEQQWSNSDWKSWWQSSSWSADSKWVRKGRDGGDWCDSSWSDRRGASSKERAASGQRAWVARGEKGGRSQTPKRQILGRPPMREASAAYRARSKPRRVDPPQKLVEAVQHSLEGKWESVDSLGLPIWHEVTVDKSQDPDKPLAQKLRLSSWTLVSQDDDDIIYVDGDFVFGMKPVWFMDAISEERLVWAQAGQPENKYKWTRHWQKQWPAMGWGMYPGMPQPFMFPGANFLPEASIGAGLDAGLADESPVGETAHEEKCVADKVEPTEDEAEISDDRQPQPSLEAALFGESYQ
eukprot:TRINITY_DN14997_c0_g2_i1.p1 TRINITY_DN14997_c0_g2~~TRINITY_DN14997_c0_g2_i1.p1  ORF type:complete len:608 (+),score=127.98 TRINITY_DN14997_c0_g2_i1:117-1940(+)